MPSKTRSPRTAASVPTPRASVAEQIDPVQAEETGAVLKLRMRVVVGAAIAVGPGKIALLEALDETRSISAAARALDMSYRRAWLLIDELNRSLQSPAVASATGGQHGGGSELTKTGRELVALYRQIEIGAVKACQTDIKKLMRMLAH